MTEFLEIFIRLFEEELALHPQLLILASCALTSLACLSLLFHKKFGKPELVQTPSLVPARGLEQLRLTR